uniref:Uncharacterized protein n=1 Tax=Triticum urartu TaxID=4572 RepID=A0A8R7TUH1_TRIUA
MRLHHVHLAASHHHAPAARHVRVAAPVDAHGAAAANVRRPAPRDAERAAPVGARLATPPQRHVGAVAHVRLPAPPEAQLPGAVHARGALAPPDAHRARALHVRGLAPPHGDFPGPVDAHRVAPVEGHGAAGLCRREAAPGEAHVAAAAAAHDHVLQPADLEDAWADNGERAAVAPEHALVDGRLGAVDDHGELVIHGFGGGKGFRVDGHHFSL